METNTTETIGCDLGDKKSELFILRSDGTSERPRSIATTPDGMRKFFTRAKAHVVIEVGAHSRWVSKLLKELEHQVTIANPRRVQLISKSDSKNDQADAELLARLGRADAKLLSPIEHRANDVQADLAVAKSRDVLVECRTKIVNSIRGMTKSFGIRLPKCSAECFHKQASSLIPDALKPAIDPLLQTLAHLDEQLDQHEQQLKVLGKKYLDVDVVSQIPGVGLLTALVFILTLEDKDRFQSSRSAGAYTGLRPRQDQSGDSDKQLRITKAGDPFLRRLLVLSANYILGPLAPDSDLQRWGLDLAKRGGKNARKRAKVAVARKLSVLMHRLWVTGEVYVPVGYEQKRRENQKQARQNLKKRQDNQPKRRAKTSRRAA